MTTFEKATSLVFTETMTWDEFDKILWDGETLPLSEAYENFTVDDIEYLLKSMVEVFGSPEEFSSLKSTDHRSEDELKN